MGLVNELDGAERVSASEREIAIDGVRNCRDLGDIPASHGVTRRGVMFRAGALDKLTDIGNKQLAQLKLAAVVDFRSDTERELAPNAGLEQLAIQTYHRGFLPGNTLNMFERVRKGNLDTTAAHAAMVEQYRTLTLDFRPIYAATFRDLLHQDNRPVLFHCASGKDRTGIFAAIVLAAAGVARDDIIDDYVLTNGRIETISLLSGAPDQAAVDLIMSAKSDYMYAAFRAMDELFGGTNGYLKRGLGLSHSEITELRTILI